MSVETDFAKRRPQHAVSKWIGHSMAVSERHYLQVDDEILDAATRSDSAVAPLQERPQSETETTSDVRSRKRSSRPPACRRKSKKHVATRQKWMTTF